MSHPWGINWQKYHQDQHDLPHIERMGYRAFTIYEWHWSNRDACRDLLAVARPDAIFLARDHPLSEQKDDLWRNDPAGKGRAHADDWAQKVKEGRVHLPLDRTYFLGLNEPDSNHYQRQIDAYNEAYCRRLAQHGLRAAAYSFGVGHPSTVGLHPDTPPDWSWYAASAAAILEGSHLAAFHEYGAPNGYGWGYWCNRISHCPYPFDAILDECGIDYGVVDAGNLKGWAAFLKPEEYLAWLDGFQAGMAERAHTRKVKLLAYNIFSYDHGSGETKDWHSFDIRPLRPLLESYSWRVVSVPANTQSTYVPSIHASPPTPVQPPQPQPAAPTVEPAKAEDWCVTAMARVLAVDPALARAFLRVESGNRGFGPDGRLIIRFENHIFWQEWGKHNPDTFNRHFDFSRAGLPWMGHRWRPDSGEWRICHTSQAEEWAVFEFARTLDAEAACRSISMGRGQIMGFNHAKLGYPSASAMLADFSDKTFGELNQIIGFFAFVANTPGLVDAMRRLDYEAMARGYNGPGNVDYYARLIRTAYAEETAA